ncbi:MAG TPA: hypothetical protein VKA47_06525 [Solirubrobacterales bacterium]|nr:hypothetical protein [Solirubrobacterales bacterium]
MKEAGDIADRQVKNLGLGDGSFEFGTAQHAPQVGDRSRGRGCGDALADRCRLRGEASRAVHPDAPALVPARRGRNGDVDGSRSRVEHPPIHGGASMAQDSSLAAGKYSRHPPTQVREVAVADGMHAAVNAM